MICKSCYFRDCCDLRKKNFKEEKYVRCFNLPLDGSACEEFPRIPVRFFADDL